MDNSNLKEKNFEEDIIRQFAYSSKNKNSIDMVIMLNGIPVVALELKNQLTDQSLEDSKRQWREDRDPAEFLFPLQ